MTQIKEIEEALAELAANVASLAAFGNLPWDVEVVLEVLAEEASDLIREAQTKVRRNLASEEFHAL